MFKSLSHFEFVFLYSKRTCSNFIDLHVAVQLSQYYLLKKLFPIVYSCLLCQRLIVGVWVLYGLSILLHYSICLCANNMML